MSRCRLRRVESDGSCIVCVVTQDGVQYCIVSISCIHSSIVSFYYIVRSIVSSVSYRPWPRGVAWCGVVVAWWWRVAWRGVAWECGSTVRDGCEDKEGRVCDGMCWNGWMLVLALEDG